MKATGIIKKAFAGVVASLCIILLFGTLPLQAAKTVSINHCEDLQTFLHDYYWTSLCGRETDPMAMLTYLHAACFSEEDGYLISSNGSEDYVAIPAAVFETEAKAHFTNVNTKQLQATIGEFDQPHCYYDDINKAYVARNGFGSFGGGPQFNVYGYEENNGYYTIYGCITELGGDEEPDSLEGYTEGVDYLFLYDLFHWVYGYQKAVVFDDGKTWRLHNPDGQWFKEIDSLPSKADLITPDTPVITTTITTTTTTITTTTMTTTTTTMATPTTTTTTSRKITTGSKAVGTTTTKTTVMPTATVNTPTTPKAAAIATTTKVTDTSATSGKTTEKAAASTAADTTIVPAETTVSTIGKGTVTHTETTTAASSSGLPRSVIALIVCGIIILSGGVLTVVLLMKNKRT